MERMQVITGTRLTEQPTTLNVIINGKSITRFINKLKFVIVKKSLCYEREGTKTLQDVITET